MKSKIFIAFVFSFLTVLGIQAQNNENVKKETTVKKVTVKDTDVETVVDKEVKETKSKLEVAGSEATNQESKDVLVKDTKVKSIEIEEKRENLENNANLEKSKLQKANSADSLQRVVPMKHSKNKKIEIEKDEGGGN